MKNTQDLPLLKRTANFGAVSALHQSSIYIGKMLVQGAVNSGGTEIISAYTATTRIEGFFRGIGKISVPVIGSTLHISIRVVLSYFLVGRMGLEAVAFATGIGWISVVLYQVVVYRKVRKKGFI